MRKEDHKAFAELISGVYEFYGKECSEFSLSVWWQAMQPFDLDTVRDALGRHCVNPDNGQYLPRPADVIRLLGGGTLDAAQIAWTKLHRAMESFGIYESVVFDDALIHAVVADMGGWIALGRVKVDELPFRAREFEQRYRGYLMRGRVDSYPRLLQGICDPQKDPVLIGDAKRAALVYERGSDGGGPQLRRLSMSDVRRLTNANAS